MKITNNLILALGFLIIGNTAVNAQPLAYAGSEMVYHNIAVYPNAAYDALIVESPQNATLTLIDENGAIAYTSKLEKGSNKLKLNVRCASYTLLIQSNAGNYVKKLLVK